MQQLIECVPNFSEGCDMTIIDKITDEIKKVDGVKLIDVDPGKATNRTVVTIVGTPDEVCEAAFQAVKKAQELIDMRHHKGAHPRFGATDVCPLVPVANITMEETVQYAHKLAERIGTELNIPIYCYEFAAKEDKRKNLATCREGEYEAIPKRIGSAEWKPDYGPAEWNESVAKSGVTAVGARNFLIAYNVNLNTTSTRRANAIAFDVRERGRVKREGNPVTGKIVKDENGNPVNVPGMLKSVKGIGWYIEEYGVAQISMNLTDITVTSLHKAYEAVYERANARGIRVTGSEMVGVVPLQAMLDAGKYFLRKQERSTGIPEREIIKIAVKSMGLDELYPFDPDKKIIEYILKEDKKQLIDMNLTEFADETASESPAPGGGSISAYVGSLGAALGTMVANLSAHKRGWDERWEEFSDWAEKGMAVEKELLSLVDEDTNAFNRIMDAFGLPKSTDAEKAARKQAIDDATKYAIEVPFRVMKVAFKGFEVIRAMAEVGNPNSVTDAGVGALCARTAVMGAFLNVKINAAGLDDKAFVEGILAEGKAIEDKAIQEEKEILEIVNGKI
ncbi:glutamate formimidoyltransferase [Carboxylicivirga mesophila]|uniref:Formimidoyltransferase-cyclodeaminase n=1 Tax=Carboxylicivirga mesophila TaxID=1166478 RepID=A0ABS5KET3_9BACT|nr:glutamate formimidoyltransferase [Carboxylicivirga mesophila]MBS2213561.1 glutamate formimidoyltransferase [Carboxylicivirga mesophila]